MTSLKVGGVPEHFNYPWYITLKNKEYSKHNINLRWQDFPGGTGQMCHRTNGLVTGPAPQKFVLWHLVQWKTGATGLAPQET